jgi:hypothetical protein
VGESNSESSQLTFPIVQLYRTRLELLGGICDELEVKPQVQVKFQVQVDALAKLENPKSSFQCGCDTAALQLELELKL